MENNKFFHLRCMIVGRFLSETYKLQVFTYQVLKQVLHSKRTGIVGQF